MDRHELMQRRLLKYAGVEGLAYFCAVNPDMPEMEKQALWNLAGKLGKGLWGLGKKLIGRGGSKAVSKVDDVGGMFGGAFKGAPSKIRTGLKPSKSWSNIADDAGGMGTWGAQKGAPIAQTKTPAARFGDAFTGKGPAPDAIGKEILWNPGKSTKFIDKHLGREAAQAWQQAGMKWKPKLKGFSDFLDKPVGWGLFGAGSEALSGGDWQDIAAGGLTGLGGGLAYKHMGKFLGKPGGVLKGMPQGMLGAGGLKMLGGMGAATAAESFLRPRIGEYVGARTPEQRMADDYERAMRAQAEALNRMSPEEQMNLYYAQQQGMM